MIVLKIILGLLGLDLVVFFHELGHFLAARLVGIDVEAFSIGWGKPLLKKKINGTEYRLGMFPIGGYCKMSGENEFSEAWENNKREVPAVPGTYFSAAPWRRILVALAGPLFNVLFACVVSTVIWLAGFEITTLPNRIVLASDIDGERYPADEAGLATGDYITAVGGKPVTNYQEVQMAIITRPQEQLDLTVERDGRELDLDVTPTLDKSSGAGKIGVYFWTDPVIDTVLPNSAASRAGLQSGDRITGANGVPTPYTVALQRVITAMSERGQTDLRLEYERSGAALTADIPLGKDGILGITWKPLRYHSPAYSLPGALVKGTSETWENLRTSARSLALLFKGIDLTRAVSGPVRITYMTGEVAAESFEEGIGEGFRTLFTFLSLISIALAVMNLLPLPVLDGGLIVLFAAETISRRPLHPRVITIFQTAGVILIGGLLVFAVFGDILFLVKK